MSAADLAPGLHVRLATDDSTTYLVIDEEPGESWRVQDVATGDLRSVSPGSLSLVDEADRTSWVRIATPGLRLLELGEAKHRAGVWAVVKVGGKWHVTHIFTGWKLGPRFGGLQDAKDLADRFAAEAPHFETRKDIPRAELTAIVEGAA